MFSKASPLSNNSFTRYKSNKNSRYHSVPKHISVWHKASLVLKVLTVKIGKRKIPKIPKRVLLFLTLKAAILYIAFKQRSDTFLLYKSTVTLQHDGVQPCGVSPGPGQSEGSRITVKGRR